ncbi:MAG: HNH endonuclease signature motif containing protein [Eubacteriales bacterium]|nr:HNH endonuclease signature motif containing protein [Eubacteriales bacterium]
MKRHKYTPEQRAFIAENIKGRYLKDVLEGFNQRFNTELRLGQLRAYVKNHNLKSGLPPGLPERYHTRKYPAEVREFMETNHVGIGHQEMADLLNDKFGTSYTKEQIKNAYGRYKLNSGLTGQFKKGQTAWNKGKECPPRGRTAETQFKKGHQPHNHLEVGSEILNTDGYWQVKIAEPNTWELKHRLVYKELHGEIPEGYVVLFADQDRNNFDTDNLILISKQQLVRMNQNGLIWDNADSTKTGVVIADLMVKAAERKKELKKKGENI